MKLRSLGLVLFLFWSSSVLADIQGEILEDHVTAQQGYTIIKVHGTYHEMGYAHGALLADRVVEAVRQVRAAAGSSYTNLRGVADQSDWVDANYEQEMVGIVEGVLSEIPGAGIDITDIKALNGMGDWAYLCRAHSSWGSRAASPYSTISTRRLDYDMSLAGQFSHLIVVYQPDQGPDWVNFTWPGVGAAVTAVNEYGNLVSIHDFQSSMGNYTVGDAPRVALARKAVATDWDNDLAQHRDLYFTSILNTGTLTGTFINFFAPNGHGAVITCTRSSGCYDMRIPRSDYYGGEVLITTNSQTDGHSTPYGGEFMANSYDDDSAMTMDDHFGIMGATGLHLVTVGFRDNRDMTLWFLARLSVGNTPKVELEWDQLFTATTPTDKCGNEQLDADELCDGELLDGQDCRSVDKVYAGGTLACNKSCSGWDTSKCVKDKEAPTTGCQSLAVTDGLPPALGLSLGLLLLIQRRRVRLQ